VVPEVRARHMDGAGAVTASCPRTGRSVPAAAHQAREVAVPAGKQSLAPAVASGQLPSRMRLDRPGFLGGRDLWEGWGSWYPGSRIPLSCGNGQ
jgi:hypothetical protein